ncbi:hypothetical protein C7S14_0451 [Burkholderia cepacia]|nr:hypothetical protein C7S14_0451 [Burkholderia cepacia]
MCRSRRRNGLLHLCSTETRHARQDFTRSRIRDRKRTTLLAFFPSRGKPDPRLQQGGVTQSGAQRRRYSRLIHPFVLCLVKIEWITVRSPDGARRPLRDPHG